jgi:hypothetical protein
MVIYFLEERLEFLEFLDLLLFDFLALAPTLAPTLATLPPFLETLDLERRLFRALPAETALPPSVIISEMCYNIYI